MLSVRKVAATLGAMAIASAAAVVVFSSGPQAAQADPSGPAGCTKTQGTWNCTTVATSTPHRNWSQTETTQQKGDFNATQGNPPEETAVVKNPAGKTPAGQQP
jgi:hypothetical protein